MKWIPSVGSWMLVAFALSCGGKNSPDVVASMQPPRVDAGPGTDTGVDGEGGPGEGGPQVIDGDPIDRTCNPKGGMEVALTRVEYNRTVRDLLGDMSSPGDAFLPDERLHGFRIVPVEKLTPERIDQYEKAAESVARAAKDRLPNLLPCDPAVVGEEPCVRLFVETFGRRAFRRPLSDEQAARLKDAYGVARGTGDFAAGIEAVIAAALKSPFFYEREGGMTPGRRARLDSYEVASRLSYFIYRSMPDSLNFVAAAADQLRESSDVEEEARRMLADPKGREGFRDFVTEWLSLDDLDGLKRDPLLHPDFEAARGYMKAQTLAFAEAVLDRGGGWSDLLRDNDVMINEPLARIYDQPGISGLAWQPAQLRDGERSGLLTHASVLAVSSSRDETSPTQRGLYLLDRFFCADFPPAPPGHPLPPPAPMAGLNKKELYKTVLTNPSCLACHNVSDSLGFPLEKFDAAGRFRTSYNGLPIDTNGATFDGRIDGVSGLVTALDPGHSGCLTAKWYDFALPRRESTELPVCPYVLDVPRSLVDIVVSVATSPYFRYAPGCTLACPGVTG